MKKVLLGTTALAAVGLLASNVAIAQDEMMAEPISVGVGGYYTTAVVARDMDGAMNDRGHVIQQNMEMQIAGSSTLDNGITVGVRVRFAANDYEHSDEQEVTFSGGFGALHVGAIEGAAQQTVVWAPGGTVPIGGIKSPWFGGIGGMWTTNAIMNEDAIKVLYFSPSFNGISLAASYAPENTTDSYGGTATNDPGQNSEGVSAALSYTVDVMGGSFSANVSYEGYTNEDGGQNPEGLRYGASISIDQIALGGAVYDQEIGGVTNSMSDIGVSWTDGPMMLGVQYGDNESNNSNIVAFNANYNLGPGIDLGLQIGAGESGANDFTQVLLGTMLNF
ncbi:MAG: porin [Rhodospirillales bacterium]|nr:porin [Rhodospirillales bacterium]